MILDVKCKHEHHLALLYCFVMGTHIRTYILEDNVCTMQVSRPMIEMKKSTRRRLGRWVRPMLQRRERNSHVNLIKELEPEEFYDYLRMSTNLMPKLEKQDTAQLCRSLLREYIFIILLWMLDSY